MAFEAVPQAGAGRPALCPGATCAAVPNGTPLFFEGDHLDGYANELLYPPFVALQDRQAERGREHGLGAVDTLRGPT